MTREEAKQFVGNSTVAPDDLTINGKQWRLECTYLTRKEALGSAEMASAGESMVLKYANGYANYERYYPDPHGRW